jgi:tryptophan 2,3-dioxygenase
VTDSSPSYWDYLGLDTLLNLQSGLDPNEDNQLPDELNFIVVHQCFELWFKLILRHVRLARDHLAAPEVPEEHIPMVVHNLKRTNTILELAVDQFKVMETLTPQGFLDFRDKLVPASGFQSFQMREIEMLLGLEQSERDAVGLSDPLEQFKKVGPHSSAGARLAKARVEAVSKEQTLKDSIHEWLRRTPIQGSLPSDPNDDEAVVDFIESYLLSVRAHGQTQIERFVKANLMTPEQAQPRFEQAEHSARQFLMAEEFEEGEVRTKERRIRAALLFIESYRDLPLLAWPRTLIDNIVELEELLVLWRTRHARMVERIIGRRLGTGGSAGVDYLDRTTKFRIFKELWSVRTLLLPREHIPVLKQPEFYGFAR